MLRCLLCGNCHALASVLVCSINERSVSAVVVHVHAGGIDPETQALTEAMMKLWYQLETWPQWRHAVLSRVCRTEGGMGTDTAQQWTKVGCY
jgi:hypothetical protein